MLDAVRGRLETEMRARAERRGACLRVLADPWTWPAPALAADDALGRISLANLNRESDYFKSPLVCSPVFILAI